MTPSFQASLIVVDICQSVKLSEIEVYMHFMDELTSEFALALFKVFK